MLGRFTSQVLLVMLVLSLLVGCDRRTTDSSSTSVTPTSRPTIIATSYPVYYFAQRLAPESNSVRYIVPEDVDPAFWEPTVADIQVLQSADLILLNGATYEKWRDWVALPEDRLVETAAAFRNEWLMAEDAVVHSHGPGGEHIHGDIDFNTWLNPQHAIKQAEAIARTLVHMHPEDSADIHQRLITLRHDLEALDAAFYSMSRTVGNTPFVASHPVYDYFAQRYRLNLRSVHWEPELEPSDEEWAEFDALIAAHPAHVMLWEDQPLDSTTERLAQRGIIPIVFDTAGSTPEEGDYLETMHANAERFKSAF